MATSEEMISQLQDELKGSDSVAFLNRMFCIDKGWTNCDRPRDIQQAALQFGGSDTETLPCSRIHFLRIEPLVMRHRRIVSVSTNGHQKKDTERR